ncbi:MAP kinase [Mycena kentingensis (nom. inval.)]|nr:MAP kinase [Mycena kentingensis (nom. inval.)]
MPDAAHPKRPQQHDNSPARPRGRDVHHESQDGSATRPDGVDRGRSRMRRTESDSNSNAFSQDTLDKKGYHALQSSFGKTFHVKKRWKLIREMGSGAYGHVISAGDEITKETVAIKLVSRVFDKIQLAKRALREITLLRHFTGHANITGLIDAKMISPDANEMQIYFHGTYGSGPSPNHQVWANSDQRARPILPIPSTTWFSLGMKYIHSSGVVHRDLKPGNLLVNSNCELKLCDFGLSRGFENASHLTEYVATRWYRAPEIMLGFREYGTAIDVWSIGCILAELLSSQPIFKGKDYGTELVRSVAKTHIETVDQLKKILDVLGSPEENVLQKIASEKARAYVRSLPISKKRPFHKILPTADHQAIDLLSHMLTFDPDARYTVAEALEDPWLAGYHEPEEEPDCPDVYDKWRDIEELTTIDQFRKAVWDEIQDYRREIRGGVDDEDEFEAVVAAASADGQDFATAVGVPEPTLPAVGVIVEEPEPESIAELSTPEIPTEQDAEEDLVKTDPIDPLPQDEIPPPASPEKPLPAFPTDPVVTYARRSSILQPRQGSLYGSPRPSSQQLNSYFAESPRTAEPPVGAPGTIAFPSSQPAYVFPARSRTGSTVGRGEGQRRLLRTLSTVSIHESAEGRAGGLADIAPIGKYIVESQPSEADAPASEMPRILEDEKKDSSEGEPGPERRSFKKEGGFFI